MLIEYSIYIIGEYTGHVQRSGLKEVKAKFEVPEVFLRKLGFQVVNPTKLGIPPMASRDEARPHCLKALQTCIAVFVLSDWKDGILSKEELDQFCRVQKGYVLFEENEGYEDATKLAELLGLLKS